MPRNWTNAHAQRIDAALKAMRAEATAFDDMSPAAVEDRRAAPFARWCQLYLPHHFACAFAPAHYRLHAALDEPTMPLWAAMARGLGKSTILSLAAPIYRLLNKHTCPTSPTCQTRPTRFQLVGALTEDLAVDLLDMVRLELQNNERLRADYGSKACLVSGDDAEWDANGVRMLALGVGQTPRGRRFGQHRPDAAVLDDLEDRFTAKNPRRSQELRDLIMQDWVPALEPGAWTMTLCLTALGRTGLLAWAQQHQQDRDPSGRRLFKLLYEPILGPTGSSAWPERFPDPQLARIRAMVGQRAWGQEYMLRTDDPDAAFKPEWFRESDPSDMPDRSDLRLVCVCDPSATSTEQNDFKAIVVLGSPTGQTSQTGRTRPTPILCLHAWLRHATPGQMVAELARVDREFGPLPIWCERNGLGEFLGEAVRRHEDTTGERLPVRGYTQRGNKADRILSLQADFENGRFAFDPSEGDQQVLIDQFLDFGKTGVHDDGPDAFESAYRRLARPAGVGVPARSAGQPMFAPAMTEW